uniref:Uncharacterized protein n=1 Tax=Arundo donax TaxID=35708 RepID=A0A0A9ASF3_ARUDO
MKEAGKTYFCSVYAEAADCKTDVHLLHLCIETYPIRDDNPHSIVPAQNLETSLMLMVSC